MTATIVKITKKEVAVCGVDKMQQTVWSFPSDRVFLFGISLKGMNLTEVLRIGQYLKILSDNLPHCEVHLGKPYPKITTAEERAERYKKLADYCRKYELEWTVREQLRQRLEMLQCETGILYLPSRESCKITSGRIVAIDETSGAVMVRGDRLNFKHNQVFLCGARMTQQNLSTFLEIGQEVFVHVDGKFCTIWVGVNRNVSSLDAIEEMKSYCHFRGISTSHVATMEARMRTMYIKNTGDYSCLDLFSGLGIIDTVHQTGGVIKGNHLHWIVEFKSKHVHVFTVSLQGHDLTTFLKPGQEVIVDKHDCEFMSVWIGAQETGGSEGIRETLEEYCWSRNVTPNVTKKLVSRLVNEERKNKNVNTKKRDIEDASVISLERHSGQLMFQGKLFSFTRDQFFAYGYSLRNVDLRKLHNSQDLKVSVMLINKDAVDKVWIGSLEKSWSEFEKWIDVNFPEKESKQFLENWNISFDGEILDVPQIPLEKSSFPLKMETTHEESQLEVHSQKTVMWPKDTEDTFQSHGIPSSSVSQSQSKASLPLQIFFSCNDYPGKIVSVAKTLGMVTVCGVSMEFKCRKVFFFGESLKKADLSVFLKIGQEVFVYAKDGKVISIWVGTRQKIDSPDIIEKMKSYCRLAGISIPLTSNLALQMRTRYIMNTGDYSCLDLSYGAGIIDNIDKQKGVIKGKNYPWIISFKRKNLHICTVQLRSNFDLTMFLQPGQEVLVDGINSEHMTVWAGKLKTAVGLSQIPRALKDYCRKRNVAAEVVKKLVSQHFTCLMTRKEFYVDTNREAITNATVVKLDEDSGQLRFQEKVLSFTRDQFYAYGYNLGNFDLRKLRRSDDLQVSIMLINEDMLHRVWIGSLKMLKPEFEMWVQVNFPEEESKWFLKENLNGTSGGKSLVAAQKETSREDSHLQDLVRNRLAHFFTEQRLTDDAEQAFELAVSFWRDCWNKSVKDKLLANSTKVKRENEMFSCMTMSECTDAGNEIGLHIEQPVGVVRKKQNNNGTINRESINHQSESCASAHEQVNTDKDSSDNTEDKFPTAVDVKFEDTDMDFWESYEEELSALSDSRDAIVPRNFQDICSNCQRLRETTVETIASQTVSTGKIIHKHLYIEN